MGVFKANRYGDRILRLIERFAPSDRKAERREEHGRDSRRRNADSGGASGRSFMEYREQLAAEGKTEAYQPWTTAEEERLKQEFRENRTLKEMAEAHQRTRGAILKRLRKLGLA